MSAIPRRKIRKRSPALLLAEESPNMGSSVHCATPKGGWKDGRRTGAKQCGYSGPGGQSASAIRASLRGAETQRSMSSEEKKNNERKREKKSGTHYQIAMPKLAEGRSSRSCTSIQDQLPSETLKRKGRGRGRGRLWEGKRDRGTALRAAYVRSENREEQKRRKFFAPSLKNVLGHGGAMK